VHNKNLTIHSTINRTIGVLFVKCSNYMHCRLFNEALSGK